MNLDLDEKYWSQRYIENSHRWDIGYPSPAITRYFDEVDDKEVRILIPGCGSAYEGEYLLKKGFKNVTLLDVSPEAKRLFLERVPDFDGFVVGDFFSLEGEFDYIVEQTFFCALNPELREEYAQKMKSLLAPNGKLVGLLFDDELYKEHPPFGGCKDEYEQLFTKYFSKVSIQPTDLSIKERLGRELFIELEK